MPVQEFGFDNNVYGANVKDFKADSGANYRLSFVWWNGMQDPNWGIKDLTGPAEDESKLSPRLLGSPRGYVPGVGMVLSTPENRSEIERLAGKPPGDYVTTMVARWVIKQGNMQKPDLEEVPTVMPWILSAEKYKQIQNLHRSGFPMWRCDLGVSCSDAKFQKMTFTPLATGLFHGILSRGKPMAKEIIDQVKMLEPIMPGRLGKDMTVQEIRMKMMGSSQGMANLPAQQGNEEVDNLLSQMLDD